jgi:O-acetyl-ADP-ribose deacetylase (regulator of RNase III)
MSSYNEVKGDLIQLAKEGRFDVIAHGCNCMCTMGAGIAPQMAKAFGANKFPAEYYIHRGEINKLGTIDYKAIPLHKDDWTTGYFNKIILDKALYVVNAYTQYNYGKNHADGTEKPLDYHALKLCFIKMNHIFKGMRIGLPQIGCGLAGGEWKVVKELIQSSFTLCDVTVVIYEKLEKENNKRIKTKIIKN